MKVIDKVAKLEQELARLKAQLKTPSVTDKKAIAEKWYADRGITIVQRYDKPIMLSTSKGMKPYEAVKFSNGRIGVYTRGNSQIAYSWHDKK